MIRAYQRSLSAASAAVAMLIAGQTRASLSIDLQLADGSRSATVSAAGQQVQINVYGIVTGANGTGADDGLQAASGSFKSTGALAGNLAGGLATPFNGAASSAGTQADLDSDGDLDVGSNNSASTAGFWLARSTAAQSPNGYSDPAVAPSTYGTVNVASYRVQLGTLTFTAGSTQAQATQINFTPRNSSSAAQWFEEVFSPSKNPGNGTFAAGITPVTITLAPEWAVDAGGDWATPGNWSADIPDGAGVKAQFLSAIQADRTVTLAGQRTLGAMTFDNANRYTIAGAGPLVMDVASGDARVEVRNGNHTIATPLTLQKTTVFDVKLAANRLVLSGDMTAAAGAGVIKQGAGTLEVKHVRADAFSITEGAVEVTASGTDAGVSYVNSLSIAGSAKLDLNDNDLVVNTGNFADIQALVLNGYRAAPDTSATGIVSTTSQTLHAGTTILALFDNSLAGFSDYPFDSGRTLSANAIAGKYTYIGDTNYDGQVSAQDYTAIDANIGTSVDPGISWFYGDTNFDGNIDATDYTGIDAALGLGQGNPLSAVPEPGLSLFVGWCGSFWIAGRRWRRGRLGSTPQPR